LMMPETIRILHLIREIRQQHHIPVCFTLDAGANVHVLYPQNYQSKLDKVLFSQIKSDLIKDYI